MLFVLCLWAWRAFALPFVGPLVSGGVHSSGLACRARGFTTSQLSMESSHAHLDPRLINWQVAVGASLGRDWRHSRGRGAWLRLLGRLGDLLAPVLTVASRVRASFLPSSPRPCLRPAQLGQPLLVRRRIESTAGFHNRLPSSSHASSITRRLLSLGGCFFFLSNASASAMRSDGPRQDRASHLHCVQPTLFAPAHAAGVDSLPRNCACALGKGVAHLVSSHASVRQSTTCLHQMVASA